MSNTYIIRLGNCFGFEGSEYQFTFSVKNLLKYSGYQLDSSEEENYIEYYCQYIFNKFFKNEYDGRMPIEIVNKYIGEDECIVRKVKEQDRLPNAIYISFYEYEYYINLKSATMTLAALLLDIHITNGVAAAIMTLLGVNSKAIAHIDRDNGERCIIAETCKKPNRESNKEMFISFNGKDCVNNNFYCIHRNDGKCNITCNNIEEIFETLIDKNVFSKKGIQFKYNI